MCECVHREREEEEEEEEEEQYVRGGEKRDERDEIETKERESQR